MSTEPTSALTFGDLILEVAIKSGLAYYGEDGAGLAQIPVDAHDLDQCKRLVNDAIRMFVVDAPPTGWRWSTPVGSFTLWASVELDDSRTVSGGAFADGVTILTANTAVFYPTMEGASIEIEGVGDYPILRYVSPTQVIVDGDASGAASARFAIASSGDYTLPKWFAGAHNGPVTFGPDTNQVNTITWVDESVIRRHRVITSEIISWPTFLAVAAGEIVDGGRPRYKLMAYPRPYTDFVVQFKYEVVFDALTDLTDRPPCPMIHDETLRAACRAVVERSVDRVMDGPDTQYYLRCLEQSRLKDARSGPRRLGYVGNPARRPGGLRPEDFRRPDVQFNP